MKLKTVLQIAILGLALAALRVGLGWAALTVSPLGEQRTLVFAINPSSSFLGVDPIAAREAFFGPGPDSTDAYYRKVSYGKTWFTGDVASVWITIPTCDGSFLPNLAASATAAAQAQGYNMDLYTRRVYISTSLCWWSGIACIGWCGTTPNGTQYSQVWLSGVTPDTHEMGHSLGMAHANCYGSGAERCDPTDTMGSGGMRELNAPHRVELGYLGTEHIQDVLIGGTYSISPLAVSDGSVKVLRIARGDGSFYFISYRQRIAPYDLFYEGLTAGVSIHLWNPEGALTAFQHTTLFVDTTPNSDLWFLDAPLTDGRTFSDSGMNITQLGHDVVGATVSISFGSPPPEPPPPEPPPPEPPSDCRPRGKSGKCK